MPIKVASLQTLPEFGEVERNLSVLDEAFARAAAAGAQIVVAPELCNTGYMFGGRSDLEALGETIPDGPSCQRWMAAAKRHDLLIVAGICERAGTKFYNSCLMIDSSGLLAVYRKVHLWDQENRHFTPGDLGFPVVETRFGRVGMFICYDSWFPESYRSCALQGADLICLPTNWVPIPGQDPTREAMANILVMAAAHSNAVNVIAADRVGTERGQPFIGQSLIVDHTGWPKGGPASSSDPEMILAVLDIEATRRSRAWGEFNVVVGDRRPDQYF